MKKPVYKNFLLVLGFVALLGILPLSQPILILFALFIAIKLAHYWFPFIRAMFRLLSFCWKVEVKTTGAKKSQPSIHYRQYGD